MPELACNVISQDVNKPFTSPALRYKVFYVKKLGTWTMSNIVVTVSTIMESW
jgi:hypothetical protein